MIPAGLYTNPAGGGRKGRSNQRLGKVRRKSQPPEGRGHGDPRVVLLLLLGTGPKLERGSGKP